MINTVGRESEAHMAQAAAIFYGPGARSCPKCTYISYDVRCICGHQHDSEMADTSPVQEVSSEGAEIGLGNLCIAAYGQWEVALRRKAADWFPLPGAGFVRTLCEDAIRECLPKSKVRWPSSDADLPSLVTENSRACKY